MDEQLYIMGLGLSLAEKIEKAIATFRLYEPEALRRDPVNGYYLCDSYGKDSGVILDLAKRSGVRFTANHNLTTLDPPELIHFGRKNHPDTIIHRPKMAMLTRLAKEKTTLPTRTGRWCCGEYKEIKSELINIIGVRAAESRRRRSWRVFTPHVVTGNWTLCPILYWSDDDVWRYTRQNNLSYCSLYDEGFTRLGCIGCPLSSNRHKEFLKWPRYEANWRRAITQFWERMHSAKRQDGNDYYWAKFKTPEDLWKWWMEELPEPADDDCQMGLF